MRKIYVLDTNVVLHDPTSIIAFSGNHVVIPMTVLEELDSIKDRKQKDVSREARIAINLIDDHLPEEAPDTIPDDGEEHGEMNTLSVYTAPEDKDLSTAPVHNSSVNDNRIIACALALQTAREERVVLVTKDINMRLKAKGAGLKHVEDYKKDHVVDDLDYISQGCQAIQGAIWDNPDFVYVSSDTINSKIIQVFENKGFDSPHLNKYLYDEKGFVGVIRRITDEQVFVEDISNYKIMNKEAFGIRPRNIHQAIALNMLFDEDIDMALISGSAGSGKTLMALSYALKAVLSDNRFNKIIVARNTPLIAEETGFLPGTLDEKMGPYLSCIEDNVEVIQCNMAGSNETVDQLMERANIQFKSLNVMRGRSLTNALIIIDEAQNLTPYQMKTLITRVGSNSKIIILGNLAQIDSNFIVPSNSGLTYAIKRSQMFEHAATINIQGVERSRLAAFAEDNL